jgi:hypothetical protein
MLEMSDKLKKDLKMIGSGLIAYIIVGIIDHSGLLAHVPHRLLLTFLLYLIPYIIVGGEVVKKALIGIKNKQMFDESFLMAVATFGAFATGENAEAVAVMLFYQVGEWFQSYAVGKSRNNISDLMDIEPEQPSPWAARSLRGLMPQAARALGEVAAGRNGTGPWRQVLASLSAHEAGAAWTADYLIEEGTHIRTGTKTAEFKEAESGGTEPHSKYKEIIDGIGGDAIKTVSFEAQSSGIISYYADGYESTLTPDNMDSLTYKDVSDIEDIPQEVKTTLEIIPVKSIEEVINHALN